MKYKALVAGLNQSVIDEFFEKSIQGEFMTTSIRHQDIAVHIKYFQPAVFLYCLYNTPTDKFDEITKIKPILSKYNIPFVLVGTREECNMFNRVSYGVSDLNLVQPFTIDFVESNLIEIIKRKKDESFPVLDSDLGNLSSIFEEPKESHLRQHILVIDDSPIMLKTIKEHLQDDYDVATAVSGKVALGFLKRKKTDLILLDYEMPEENGLAVLQKLRSNAETKDIPVVFLTGVSEREKIREALLYKPQGYLLKPIDHEKLKETIAGLIGVS